MHINIRNWIELIIKLLNLSVQKGKYYLLFSAVDEAVCDINRHIPSSPLPPHHYHYPVGVAAAKAVKASPQSRPPRLFISANNFSPEKCFVIESLFIKFQEWITNFVCRPYLHIRSRLYSISAFHSPSAPLSCKRAHARKHETKTQTHSHIVAAIHPTHKTKQNWNIGCEIPRINRETKWLIKIYIYR